MPEEKEMPLAWGGEAASEVTIKRADIFTLQRVLGKCPVCGTKLRLVGGITSCPVCSAWRRWGQAQRIAAIAGGAA